MEYEQLLNEAYENIKVSTECERFEILKVKGHHEGIRTVIVNFYQVCSCLRRSPEHLGKFLSKELASQCEIRGDRFLLSRKLTSREVNDKIEKYVNLFVLCPKCKKPDSELVESVGKLYLHCLACGEKHEVHKL